MKKKSSDRLMTAHMCFVSSAYKRTCGSHVIRHFHYEENFVLSAVLTC